MNKLILLMLCTIGVTGCTVGQNDFNCSSGDQNALCASTRTIYKATDEDIQENETITYIKDGEVQQVTLNELKKQRASKGAISENISDSANYSSVPFAFSYDGNILRKDVKVLRVWIAPWVDEQDDLNLSTLVYTDIEKRKWEIGTTNNNLKPSGAAIGIANYEPSVDGEEKKYIYRPAESDMQRINSRFQQEKTTGETK